MFIDVTSKGCGSGCKYCYIDGPAEQQEYFSIDEVIGAIEERLRSGELKTGRNGTLLSFCPHTEPFKTTTSTAMIARILRHVAKFDNPIQISTKEPIPSDFQAALANQHNTEGQLIIFTSVTSISHSENFEPFAADPKQRAANFETCRRLGIPSCLFIKPLLKTANRELEEFLTFVETQKPDSICIGISYTRKTKSSPGYVHPTEKLFASDGFTNRNRIFIDAIRSVHPRVFFNSTCVSSYYSDREPPRPIWKEHPELCVRCRTCGDITPNA